MNMQMLMKQAQKMQKDMEKSKEEVAKMTFIGKQPLVEVTVNGNKEVTNIKINEEISSDDIEVLQDMILLATNDALKQASKAMEDKMGNLSSGLAGLF
ncbi:MAG: YbaB/EbfC family nucleoid-associated protein [Bacilli bacterium]|nr:YbaB/EbfC family nucleoid-associated protein [Bacilli bacterium]